MDEVENPRNQSTAVGKLPLESMSVDELDHYRQSLEIEIERVNAERERKLSVRLAAERLFTAKS